MKFINAISQILLSSLIFLVLIFWLTAYNSAFEADRACHSLLASYPETSNLDCDHDTETHKWILYENQEDLISAKVIKIFRYKFL